MLINVDVTLRHVDLPAVTMCHVLDFLLSPANVAEFIDDMVEDWGVVAHVVTAVEELLLGAASVKTGEDKV